MVKDITSRSDFGFRILDWRIYRCLVVLNCLKMPIGWESIEIGNIIVDRLITIAHREVSATA
jgi:hypothetical protein